MCMSVNERIMMCVCVFSSEKKLNIHSCHRFSTHIHILKTSALQALHFISIPHTTPHHAIPFRYRLHGSKKSNAWHEINKSKLITENEEKVKSMDNCLKHPIYNASTFHACIGSWRNSMENAFKTCTNTLSNSHTHNQIVAYFFLLVVCTCELNINHALFACFMVWRCLRYCEMLETYIV